MIRKSIVVLIAIFTACSFIACGSGTAAAPNSAKIGGEGIPQLVFTSVPPLGSSDPLKGNVLHVVPANYAVVVYIRVFGKWWIKPRFDAPLTSVASDGTWTTVVDTGASDPQADQITAFLVPAGYNPPLLDGASDLPQELTQNAVATATVSR